MSNKKETPVSWLVFELSKVGYLPDGLPTSLHNKALQMEAQKQQKYDEMLAMLEVCNKIIKTQELEQLVKEAKEL
jgi:hypothetical protein